MSQTSSAITLRTIQEAMPDYHFSPDLLEGMLTAIPPPPAAAGQAWRHARLTRILQELAALHPFDAAQARLAAQIIVAQFAAEDLTRRAAAAEVSVEQACRLGRTASELMRTAERLVRALAQRQTRPAPFWAPQLAEGFDLDALDAAWQQGTRPSPPPVPGPAPRHAARPSAGQDPGPPPGQALRPSPGQACAAASANNKPMQRETASTAAPAPARRGDAVPVARTDVARPAPAPSLPAPSLNGRVPTPPRLAAPPGAPRAAAARHAPARLTSATERPPLLCEAVRPPRTAAADPISAVIAARQPHAT